MSVTHSATENVCFGLIMGALWFCMACKMDMMTFSCKFRVKNFWIDTCVFWKFETFNFQNDIRNFNNAVQYRSASGKAFHIDNEKTDSNYFGHLHGML
jgi:hypothetical protein